MMDNDNFFGGSIGSDSPTSDQQIQVRSVARQEEVLGNEEYIL